MVFCGVKNERSDKKSEVQRLGVLPAESLQCVMTIVIVHALIHRHWCWFLAQTALLCFQTNPPAFGLNCSRKPRTACLWPECPRCPHCAVQRAWGWMEPPAQKGPSGLFRPSWRSAEVGGGENRGAPAVATSRSRWSGIVAASQVAIRWSLWICQSLPERKFGSSARRWDQKALFCARLRPLRLRPIPFWLWPKKSQRDFFDLGQNLPPPPLPVQLWQLWPNQLLAKPTLTRTKFGQYQFWPCQLWPHWPELVF